MAQDTTEEFAKRLNQAIETSPHAPPQQYGRVTWLRRELENRLKVKVSLNTVHKWTTGASRPREDRVRDLANLLKVDEIWLAMGRRPTETPAATAQHAAKSNGAVLVVAGLIELDGGRVTFPQDGSSTIRANVEGSDLTILALTPQFSGENITLVVPEPTNGARVIAVIPNGTLAKSKSHVELLDVTDCERQHFGGFSVLEMKLDAKGVIRAPHGKCGTVVINSVRELVVG